MPKTETCLPGGSSGVFLVARANYQAGNVQEAARLLRGILQRETSHLDATILLGLIHHELGELGRAATLFRRAVLLKPSFPPAQTNLGNVLKDLNDLSGALACYERASSLEPRNPNAHYNMALALSAMNEHNLALQCLAKALSLAPDFADAQFNKSWSLLIQGNFLEGWRLHEWRWRKSEPIPFRLSRKPVWTGKEALENKRLLLWGEQGFGDQIQFIRFLGPVAARGAKVLVEVAAPLVGLFSKLGSISRIAQTESPIPDDDFDFHCPIMSLPYVLQTSLNTIPRPLCLKASSDRISFWRNRLGPKRKRRIGVAWRGNPHFKDDRLRSIGWRNFRPLLDLDAEWFVIQKDLNEAERKLISSKPDIRAFDQDLVDFEDSAALVEEMDLIISSDTSLVHLAGSIGKKCWVLLAHSPDWRWLLDRDDSPWYESVRLFRQGKPNDWGAVVECVKHALGQMDGA